MQNGGKSLAFSSSFPFQTSLNHLLNNGNTTLLIIDYFILGMGAFLVHIKLPFLLTQMWHIWNWFCLSFMFFKRVWFRTQNNLLSLHSQAQNAPHMVNFSKITLKHFYPWKLCSSYVFAFAKDIVVLKKFFGNGLFSSFGKTWILNRSGVVGGVKVGKPPKHTNCTIRLLCFDSKFDATLLLFKFVSKEVIARNLSGITKKDLSSGLQLDLKKKGKTMLATLQFTFPVEAIEFTQCELQEKFVVRTMHVTHYIVHTTHRGNKI